MKQQGEELHMLPQPGGRPSVTGRAGNNARGGVPFLKTTDVFTDPRKARVIGVRSQIGRFGAEVVLKISFNSQMYLWSLRPDNPNYDTMFTKLGGDESEWVDVSFDLSIEEDEFTGKSWPHISHISKNGSVEDSDAAPTRRRKKG